MQSLTGRFQICDLTDCNSVPPVVAERRAVASTVNQVRGMLECTARSSAPAVPGWKGHGCVVCLKPCGQRQARHRVTQLASFPSRCRAVAAIASSVTTAVLSQLSSTNTLSRDTDMEVPIPELQQLCHDALQTIGYTHEQSSTITEVGECNTGAQRHMQCSRAHQAVLLQVLLYAQLRNNSNNMVKVITGGFDKLFTENMPEIQQQSDISAVINGHHSAGIIVMKQALELALTKAKSKGCGIVGTNHTATGSGAIG